MAAPETPPTGHPVLVNLPPSIAQKLAFYGAENTGVLAPRGWQCHGADGILYTSLSVFPDVSTQQIGPVVTYTAEGADNIDGAVTRMLFVCRYFPHENTSQGCINGNWLPPKDAEIQPPPGDAIPRYPADRLKYLSSFMIKYVTPAGFHGLGTMTRYAPPWDMTEQTPRIATYGILMLGFTEDGQNDGDGIQQLIVRLPSNLDYLRSAIMNFSEACFLAGNKSACATADVYQEGAP